MHFDTEEITTAALVTLLWTGLIYDEADPDHPTPADAEFTADDFAPEQRQIMLEHVTGFLCQIDTPTRRFLFEEVRPDQIGHDLVLTAQHHGTGFWDRGYPSEIGDALTTAAHTFSMEFERGDDGKPYIV